MNTAQHDAAETTASQISFSKQSDCHGEHCFTWFLALKVANEKVTNG